MDKFKCKCHGIPRNVHLCVAATVGGKFCTAEFKCEYKEPVEEEKQDAGK